MPVIAPPDSTLIAIQKKVRRITRSPSQSSLTDDQLNDYINTFILYDFPEQIRVFPLRQLLTFYTQPNVDVYSTNTVDTANALYDFQNRYIAVHPPVFLAGIQGFFTEWRDVFYGYYPQTNTIADSLLRGDGTAGPFTGTIVAKPMIQSNVIITCLDTSGQSMVLVDYPLLVNGSPSTTTGALGLPNEPQTLPSPYGQINYVTGQFTAIFPNLTQTQAIIYVENIAYQPGKPLAVLFYNNEFTIRPVPDKTYSVQIEVDVRPTQFLATNQSPQLQQWWQYIALGTSYKIFQDKMDVESAQKIYPEFKLQERLILRTTLTQQANERTVTIYTQGKQSFFEGGFGTGGWPY